MSYANPNEARKRHLPQWMLGVRAASTNPHPVSNSESEAKVKVDDDKKVHKTPARNVKSRAEAQKHDNKSSSSEDVSKKGNSHVLKKCGGRRSKRKPDTEHKLEAMSSKGTTNDRENEEETTFSEEELTVEDMISIAKELVKNNSARDEESSSPMTDKLRVSSSSTSLSKGERLHNQSVDLSEKDNFIGNLLHSASDFIDNRTSNTRSITSSHGQSRDSARDMLDILLGPMLKRSKESERRTDLLLPTMITTVDFDQGDKQKRQGEVEVEPLTKKKSSLKEKVAMLLN